MGKYEKFEAEMKVEIKESKDEWIATVRKYDDPDIDIVDVWG